MLIFIMIIATLLTAAWLFLLIRTQDDDLRTAARAKVFDTQNELLRLSVRSKEYNEKIELYTGITRKYMKLLMEKRMKKKAIKLKEKIELLLSGEQKGINILSLPGFVLQREIEAIGKSGFRKIILTNSYELYGKKYAVYKTADRLAKMLSYPIIGIAAVLALGTILLCVDNVTAGISVIVTGMGLVMVFVYGIYDELSDMVNKRHKSISRHFPNVISKLALLVTSGMIMDKAWKETAYSRDTELYIEMQKTSEELDNLVGSHAAYQNFISRCNTKETAKLASAILQNQSKGNAEIGRLLKDMAHEVWQERRHTAKREAEKANSKLMIPTMLLFLAIMIMLMVPIAMNFSGI